MNPWQAIFKRPMHGRKAADAEKPPVVEGEDGQEDEGDGWLFETANITAMSTTHAWVLQRRAHVVAVQEHAVPARTAHMFKAMAGAQRRTMELGPAAGDPSACNSACTAYGHEPGVGATRGGSAITPRITW